MPTKTDYILRSLQKIRNKKWEFFIISRIIHALDDDEIEFVTQQYVRKNDGAYALTDLYFPQFDLHLEIDEPPHEKEIQKQKDTLRTRDLVLATGHTIERLKTLKEDGTLKSLPEVRKEVDAFVDKMRIQKTMISDFLPWNFETRYSPEPVIERGFVKIADNVVFRTQIDAMRCFGFKGNGWQKGAWKIPDSDCYLWFPRLFEHGMWQNELSEDGKVIHERAINSDGRASIAKQRRDISEYPNRKAIVFAKAKDALGYSLLRYVGTFQPRMTETHPDVISFDRIKTCEKVRI
ncbi:AbaSI family restriction endonuclease [Lentibacter algarum]|uniref:AbaSI family restriction endonuclease n=1 Tax=Lentibacter algarum TaxID=576131 RepID=UPI00339D7583